MNFAKFIIGAIKVESKSAIDVNQETFGDILRLTIEDNIESVDEMLDNVILRDPLHSANDCEHTFHKMFRQTDVCSTPNQDLVIWKTLNSYGQWHHIFKYMYANKIEIMADVDKAIEDYHFEY